jgi:glycosyltransferase involved in cell wall biosynthesis
VSALTGRRVVHLTSDGNRLGPVLGSYVRACLGEGMEVVVVSDGGPFAGPLVAGGARHVALRHPTPVPAAGQGVRSTPELTRTLRRIGPDVVHTHDTAIGLPGRIAARFAGVPAVVHTVRGLGGAGSPLRRARSCAAERLAAAWTGLELVERPADLALLARMGVPPDRLAALPTGVDLERFRPQRTVADVGRARAALGVDPSAVVAGSVASSWGRDAWRDLDAAAARMRGHGTGVVFVMVGRQDPTAQLPARAPGTARRGHVVLTGWRDDVPDLHAGFDLFVAPVDGTALPRPALEAMASGLPLVAVDDPVGRSVVEHGVNGLLVRRHDAGALAAAIADLAGDPARRGTMGARARARAVAEFDDRRTVGTALDAYRRLLDAPPRVPPSGP